MKFAFNELGTLLQHIDALIRGVDISFQFSPKQCNRVAHSLASRAFVSGVSEIRDSLFLDWLNSHVALDLC